MPRFTIVIPTKNRPSYLADTIYSVLNQSFSDLECIVSDNHNDERTQEVLDRYSGDSRLRVVKPTEELNMPDHWEFATRCAEGDYVMLLADRKVLYRDGLARVQRTLAELGDIDALSVGVRQYVDQAGHMGWSEQSKFTGLLDPSQLLHNFYTSSYFEQGCLDSYYPKSLNGLFRASFVEKVRSSVGSYFNIEPSITPDYSSFFVNVGVAERLAHIGQPIILTQGEHVSHGRNFGKGDYTYYMNSLRWEDPYSLVPYKHPFIYTLLYQDSFAIRDAVGGRLLESTPNWAMYMYNIAIELRHKMDANVLLPEEMANCISSFNDLLTSLELTEAEQVKARKAVEGVSTFKSKISLNPVHHLRDHVRHRYTHWAWVNRLIPYRFPDALAAAGHY